MRHNDVQLQELEDLLGALPWENDGMLLSELDGFVAGLIVCPDPILPSEWLPVVWGGDEKPPFESGEQAEAVVNAVMAHYNRAAATLVNPNPDYVAIMDEDIRTGEVLWEAWVDGFEKAMQLRPDAWEEIVESDDEEAAASVTMLLEMNEIDKGTSQLSDTDIERIEDMAPSLIPEMVVALNNWTKAQVAGADTNRASRAVRSRKIGRNDPCPCGSGRKYKRCCGAN